MNWSVLESISGLIAVPATWRKYLGDDFPAFATLCLDPHPYEVESYPCPCECGCWHRVVREQNSPRAIGMCRCKPPKCPDLSLTADDLGVLHVNAQKLGRALCKAFDAQPKHAQLQIPKTIQFASWSADAVPMFLTLQFDRQVFRRAVAELGTTLRRPFILFTPTTAHLDAHCQQLLAAANAACFTLDSTVQLTDHGMLHSVKTPGEVFTQFTPQPKEADQTVLQRAFAIVQQLDSEGPANPPGVVTVFRLYCIEGLSVDEIARRCGCSKGTVWNRLALIRVKTGMKLHELRGKC